MLNLNDIISTFSAEEQNNFISYLKKKNKRNDTKNSLLFKLLLKNELSSKEICHKIYGTNKKGAYHALRKRLHDSLIDFVANINLEEENSIDMQLVKYIIVSRNFLIHKHYKAAYKILDKAEALAKEHFLFAILNEIYHTKIQYAYANSLINIDDLVKKFTTNQKNHYLEDQLNIVYAKIRQTINNITYNSEVLDFETILNSTLKEHNISLNETLSFKALYQLMRVVSISAFVSNDYLKLEPFLISTYTILRQHTIKENQQHYHIEVLYMLANTLFRNKKFNESLHYLALMEEQIELNKKKHYNTFKLKYSLLLALNLNYSNKQNEAISLLEKFIISKHPDLESLLDIYLSLITCYFQKNEFKKAASLFSKFYHTDNWYGKKAGIEWVIKKNLIEILLHIELENFDLVESRLLSFKRNYFEYLKNINQERVLIYLGLVERYYKNPENITTPKFNTKVEASFEWIGAKREDIFVMSFYAWLKSKMDRKPLFTTTLNLIEKAQNVN